MTARKRVSDDEDDNWVQLKDGQIVIEEATLQSLLAFRTGQEERELQLAKLNDVNFKGMRDFITCLHESIMLDRAYIAQLRGDPIPAPAKPQAPVAATSPKSPTPKRKTK